MVIDAVSSSKAAPVAEEVNRHLQAASKEFYTILDALALLAVECSPDSIQCRNRVLAALNGREPPHRFFDEVFLSHISPTSANSSFYIRQMFDRVGNNLELASEAKRWLKDIRQSGDVTCCIPDPEKWQSWDPRLKAALEILSSIAAQLKSPQRRNIGAAPDLVIEIGKAASDMSIILGFQDQARDFRTATPMAMGRMLMRQLESLHGQEEAINWPALSNILTQLSVLTRITSNTALNQILVDCSEVGLPYGYRNTFAAEAAGEDPPITSA